MKQLLLLFLLAFSLRMTAQSYAGAYGPMSEADFQGILARVQKEGFDSKRAPLVRQALVGNRLNSAMLVRLLQAFDYDSNRLPVAKEAYTQIQDPYNYLLVCDAFDYSSSCSQLKAHISTQVAAAPQPVYAGGPAADFSGVLARVRQASFDRERTEVIQVALAGRQMRAEVLASLLKEYDYDSNRLSIAQYAYAWIADPHNYFCVVDALTYSSNQQSLKKFIGITR
jgi:hypothetical protein